MVYFPPEAPSRIDHHGWISTWVANNTNDGLVILKKPTGGQWAGSPAPPPPELPSEMFHKDSPGQTSGASNFISKWMYLQTTCSCTWTTGVKKKKLRTKINWSVNCVRQGNQSEQVRLCSASCCAEQVDVDAGGASERQSGTWSSVLCCRTFALKDSGLNLSAASEFTAEENSIKCARLRYSPSSQPSEKVCKK